MKVYDLFSKRQRQSRGEVPDVYAYDKLPQPLRVQIVHIVQDAFGKDHFASSYANNAYKFVNDTLCREYGAFQLDKRAETCQAAVISFFLQEQSTERALDVVEFCFKIINTFIRDSNDYASTTDREIEPNDAIAELNERFKEHGIGYQFASNEIIRVDSEFLHSAAVKPTLVLLQEEEFNGANDEFLNAHEHYRHGRYKECLVDTLKSFESTMKVICKRRGWPTQPSDTAKNLIATCFANGLLPAYLESQLGSLRSLLESGVPTIRNKAGGHGQGTEVTHVPEFLASYALHLTASSILFIAKADAANP
jgi:AbiJ N-terminal domain 4